MPKDDDKDKIIEQYSQGTLKDINPMDQCNETENDFDNKLSEKPDNFDSSSPV